MSTWDDISKFIGSVAPTVANAILPGSGIAVSMLSKALVGVDDASPDQIQNALKDDPDTAIKLQKLENEYQETALKYQAQEDNLEITAPLADMADARSREVDLRKAGTTDYTPQILAYINTFGFFSMLVCMFFFQISETMKDVAYLLVGVLSTNVTSIVSYYFGSSIGSKVKDGIISGSNKPETKVTKK